MCLFNACAQKNYKCFLDCQDVTVVGSKIHTELKDASCEACKQQFFITRAAVCGVDENPNCACSYVCESLFEWKYG